MSRSDGMCWDYVTGDSVLAEYRDERYYPATVLSTTDCGVDVKFANGSTAIVPQANLVKCDVIPVGCTVLAKSAESDWYEPAVIQSFYADGDSQQQGYVVVFTGQTSCTRYSSIVFHCH